MIREGKNTPTLVPKKTITLGATSIHKDNMSMPGSGMLMQK